MPADTSLSIDDERDIELIVEATIERGSITEAQAIALGVSRESFTRNGEKIAARIRARSVHFAP
ncbi:hypothetical protein G6M02_14345 [Agrobacterium rhizogenes]|jgi:hypothetical protein|nr:hypothetical protein [Rhizobium rhizogenes]